MSKYFVYWSHSTCPGRSREASDIRACMLHRGNCGSVLPFVFGICFEMRVIIISRTKDMSFLCRVKDLFPAIKEQPSMFVDTTQSQKCLSKLQHQCWIVREIETRRRDKQRKHYHQNPVIHQKEALSGFCRNVLQKYQNILSTYT